MAILHTINDLQTECSPQQNSNHILDKGRKKLKIKSIALASHEIISRAGK